MAVNKFRPHLYIIPEDDANRQNANGFEKDDRITRRALQIVAPAGGWRKAIEKFTSDYFTVLGSNKNSHVLAIIDCDGDDSRIERALADIPTDLKNRVFILGTLTEPETLKQDLHVTLETIGQRIANQCFDANEEIWEHEQLRHNASELARVRSVLFRIVFNRDD